MTRRIQLLAVLLVTAFAVPATAQVRINDHRRKKPAPRLAVTDFQPTTGRSGDTVTIRGRGFTPRTQVLFGGRTVRKDKVQPGFIKFRVPARTGDGEIVLRHPNVARDIRVGRFVIDAAPVITGFAPRSGVPGTRVAITGRRFRNTDQVLLGGQPVQIIRSNARRIVIAIPANGTTGFLTVVRAGNGGQASARAKFAVVTPAPEITSVSPDTAPPGSTVRVAGANFGPRDTLYYAKVPMRIVRRGAGFVDAVIPSRARKDRFIFVAGANGEARSARPFRLEQPPVLNRVTPLYGHVGDRVDVFGKNFRPGDQVTIGGAALRTTQLRGRQITATIPAGVRSGPIAIQRGGLVVAARRPFDVVYAPAIREVRPPGAQAGSRVTIVGSEFTRDAAVFYGAKKLRIVRRAPGSLTVVIPRKAIDQFLTVRTRGGDARSPNAFQVYTFPTVKAVLPNRAFVGSAIMLRGKKLRNVQSVTIGGVSAPILERTGRTLTVEIPRGARSGAVEFTSYGQSFPTRHQFEVLRAPVITDFSPRSGYPGSDITIAGRNFTRQTRVFFGNTPLTIVRSQLPTQLVVRMPQGAVASEHLFVGELDVRARSRNPFVIIAAPAITGFSPPVGKPGSEIVINGANLTPNTEVLLGNRSIQIVRRLPSGVVVRLPVDAAAGKVRLHLALAGTVISTTRRKLKILPAAVITGFAPHRTKPGTRIQIGGRNLDSSVQVFFGTRQLAVVKLGRRGRKLWVQLPPDLAGVMNFLRIVDNGAGMQSKQRLQITGAPPPPPRRGPKVKDHRRR